MVVKSKKIIAVIPVKYFKKFPPTYSEISIMSLSLNLKNKLKRNPKESAPIIIIQTMCAKLAVPKVWTVKVGPVKILGIIATHPKSCYTF